MHVLINDLSVAYRNEITVTFTLFSYYHWPPYILGICNKKKKILVGNYTLQYQNNLVYLSMQIVS